MRVIDVEHLGRPHVIGCWEVDGALVDPGPESSLPTLLEKLGEERPRALLLTHIHLDHAAATGALVERWPDLEVFVHERGAPHLIDPSKLLASAERLYGDQMEHLWGRILPVPEANVRSLAGGETVLGMRVAYTPGHASHHVCYLHEETGTAFVGDVAAVRIPPTDLVLPPTPPPDIDIELWEKSIGIVEGWEPERLALTHFGLVEEPAEHLEAVRTRL
ncbi:MAG TPA: MBL fold metallo-hydrolase, partial [Solirubrobacterales bacterium]|nr:MBL fold metallo-hydrolase [Solirubrobacterales bacterium]